MLKLFGMPNCDQLKKSQKWLKDNSIEYIFHDYRKHGITKKLLVDWCNLVSWEILLNKRSRTWKELSEKDKSNLSESKAISLMQQYPTLIKRPVLQNQNTLEVGFDAKVFVKRFK